MNGKSKKRMLLRRMACIFLLAAMLGITASCANFEQGDQAGDEATTLEDTALESEDSSDTVAPEDRPTIYIRDGVVDLEKKAVEIKIDIVNNPGISALQFSIHYGDELMLQSVQFDSRFGSYVTTPMPYDNPQTITFMSPLREIAENGNFATLVFQITDEARANTTVHLHADVVQENTLDADLQTVEFAVVTGKVKIP
jgi:hypothetical protein